MQMYIDICPLPRTTYPPSPCAKKTRTQVSTLQAQAKEEVAADHGLELKYQQQAEEYQKDVEQLALWP